ncbi:MAG: tyrosine-type recombinase/integrase [Xanthobacteraceae bacterium]
MHRIGKDRQPLTALIVERLKRSGRYGDGDGLYLSVSTTGSKSWLFIGILHGKRHVAGLGPLTADNGLLKARTKAAELRARLKEGIPPVKAKALAVAAKAKEAADQAAGITFGQVADEVIAARRQDWSAKHDCGWHRSMTVHCAPLRNKPVSEIDVTDVLGIVGPLWDRHLTTALRTRARIEKVLDHAKVKYRIAGDNVARWRGGLEHLLPKPKSLEDRVKHLPAIHYGDVPTFIARLRDRDSIVALALEFCILTATRSSETLGAKWGEIDLEERLWVIPAERMKAGKPHRIPLSDRAIAILNRLAAFRTIGDLVFPGDGTGKRSANSTMWRLLRELQPHITVHGFRSAFRTWCYEEQTQVPDAIAEEALAHRVGNAVRRAYVRGDALDQRRALMRDWARHCEPKIDNIRTFGRRKGLRRNSA